jgi:hypothetical protein
MNAQKDVLTPKDLQRLTGKSLRLLYRELRKHNIPSVKCGSCYLIGRESFYRWLNGQN